MTKYAVAFKKTSASQWNLASYPWYDDPAQAEQTIGWLKKTSVFQIDTFAVAVITIEEPPAKELL